MGLRLVVVVGGARLERLSVGSFSVLGLTGGKRADECIWGEQGG